ncbi:NAD(P)-dependent oxidoreductase [Carnobacterium maltaromaticum]|uniref:SDR family oxidoreductase n=1 Tax=Carnobacterium maltaromaticum TaxID=2751 RepID=UPI00298AD126|nr:NAD(P)-dependent oxidoreductase [Carnobacterium maltaromaticum]MDW5525416.1 NAD(P)-dependent oxidoreductase [Carnobacterium maltaromaticum]
MILVTGILGHTGKHFIDKLEKEKYNGKIRIIVKPTTDTSYLNNSKLDFEKIIGNTEDIAILDSSMKNVDQVLHIYNIHQSVNIIKAAIKANVKRVILVHTTGIYSNFKKASFEYKNIEEEVKILAKGKISVTILRPSMIYGDLSDHNMSKFIKMVDKLRVFPIIGKGKGLIQPVNAKDLGNTYYKVLKDKQITWDNDYNLTGEQPIELKAALQIISKELNKKTFFLNIPYPLSVFSARVLKIITVNKINIIEKIQRMTEDRAYSHLKATHDFGFNPMSFERGIKAEVIQYKEMKSQL